jgi:hypothetical protein
MFWIVPAADQAPDHMFLPLSTGRTEIRLPLESSPVSTILLPVARWLSFPRQRGTRAELIAWIDAHLSLVPMESAVARWPVLASGSAQAMERVAAQIRRETPQFAPHLGAAIAAAGAAARTAAMEAERQAQRERAPPDWLESAARIAPAGPHIVVHLRVSEEEHDGCCSAVDESDLEERESEELDMFLPLTDADGDPWDLDAQTEWREHAEGHCCCGADVITRVAAVAHAD